MEPNYFCPSCGIKFYVEAIKKGDFCINCFRSCGTTLPILPIKTPIQPLAGGK